MRPGRARRVPGCACSGAIMPSASAASSGVSPVADPHRPTVDDERAARPHGHDPVGVRRCDQRARIRSAVDQGRPAFPGRADVVAVGADSAEELRAAPAAIRPPAAGRGAPPSPPEARSRGGPRTEASSGPSSSVGRAKGAIARRVLGGAVRSRTGRAISRRTRSAPRACCYQPRRLGPRANPHRGRPRARPSPERARNLAKGDLKTAAAQAVASAAAPFIRPATKP